MYVLKNAKGEYIHRNSTLGGRCIRVYYNYDIYQARLIDDIATAKRCQTIINNREGQFINKWNENDGIIDNVIIEEVQLTIKKV